MNISTPSSTPSISIEDFREALKKYPHEDRLILSKNQQTGKISLIGSPVKAMLFHSEEETQENRDTLQALCTLIRNSYRKPIIDYVPHINHRIEYGLPLDSETLRQILFHTTGTIHGATGSYEYQACLADPERNAISDLPEGFIHPDDASKSVRSVAQAATAISKLQDTISSLRFQEEDETTRYKNFALHPNELIPLRDPLTKEPTPGIK